MKFFKSSLSDPSLPPQNPAKGARALTAQESMIQQECRPVAVYPAASAAVFCSGLIF